MQPWPGLNSPPYARDALAQRTRSLHRTLLLIGTAAGLLFAPDGAPPIAASSAPPVLAQAAPTTNTAHGKAASSPTVPKEGNSASSKEAPEEAETEFWDELVRWLTDEGGTPTGGKGDFCTGRGWVLQAPLRGGHHTAPLEVRWTALRNATRYELALRNLGGSVLWSSSLEAGPEAKLLRVPFPKEAWERLGSGQGSLEIEAFDQEGHRLHSLTQQLWAIPEAQWQAFEAEEEKLEAPLCSSGEKVGGLSCDQFRALHRAFKAKGRLYYAEALRCVEPITPLEETRQLALSHARSPTKPKTGTDTLRLDLGLRIRIEGQASWCPQ